MEINKNLTKPSPSALTWAQAVDWAAQLSKKYAKAKPVDQPSFYLLNACPGSVEAERVKISRPSLLSESDLALHYGPDAVEFERELVESIGRQTGGISVFRGEAGTGKTTFARHLIAKLQSSHRFYYLPVNATRYLSSPDMVDFLVARDAGGAGCQEGRRLGGRRRPADAAQRR